MADFKCDRQWQLQFDTTRLATVLMIFYHLQFVATAFLLFMNAIYYAIRMISFLDSPTHQAFAIENLLWQTVRGFVAFVATFGLLCLFRNKCKRRLCVVQGRRISRKSRGSQTPSRFKLILFITLLLDSNVVNAFATCDGPETSTDGIDDERNNVSLALQNLRPSETDLWWKTRITDQLVNYAHQTSWDSRTLDEVYEAAQWPWGDFIWLFRVEERLHVEGEVECIDEGRVIY